MRWLMAGSLSILAIASFALIVKFKPTFAHKIRSKISPSSNNNTSIKANVLVVNKLKSHAAGLKNYATAHQYNNNCFFLIDLSVESGKNRFFVYDKLKDSVLLSGLVTHGSGTDQSDSLKFSNEQGSYCSSPGKYKIGGHYFGQFGYAYKLNGLDLTNSNAYARAVVLHAHSCVPAAEVFPYEICESWGCPTVSPAFLEKLKPIINQSARPMLLEIYR